MEAKSKIILVLEAVDNASKKINGALLASQRNLDKFSRVSASFGRNALTGAVAIGAPVALAVNEAVKFEDSFAGVQKTFKGTSDQLEALKQTLVGYSKDIPVTTERLNEIAESAGQLGIQTANIAKFTRTIADLGATTNLGDEAAADFAKFANITKMAQGDFDRLGSVVVDLGNNMATTERDIVAFGMRLAGAGAQVGIHQSKIMGFAAALSSVGLEAEAGGTAMSKVFIDLAQASAKGGAQLQKIAKVAGMTGGQFAEAFKTDAAGAVTSFVEGLGKIKAEGGNTFQVLEELGYTEVRLRDALLRASGAGNLMRQSLTISEKAWRENNALTKEAETRYNTTASKIRIFKNNVQALAVTAGNALLPALTEMLGKLSSMAQWIGDLAKRYPVFTKVVGIAAAVVASFLAVLGVTGIVASAVASGLSALAGAFAFLTARTTYATAAQWLKNMAMGAGVAIGGALVVSVFALSAAYDFSKKAIMGAAQTILRWVSTTKLGAAAQWALNIAMSANPVGLLIAGIAAAIGVVALLVAKWHELVAWFKETPIWLKAMMAPLLIIIGPILAIAAAIRWVIDNWEDMSSTISSGVNSVLGFFTSLWDGTVGIFNDIIDFLAGLPAKMFEAGKTIVNAIVDGMLSVAMAPVDAIIGIVDEVRAYLPFSPAKKGALRDIHRIKLVETVAQGIKPAPMVKAMGVATMATMMAVPQAVTAAGPSARAAMPRPVSANSRSTSATPAGAVTLNFSPNITVTGSAGSAQDISAEMKKLAPQIMAMLRTEQQRQERRRF